jgi:hypothetical protein
MTMDDSKIAALRSQVLSELRHTGDPAASADLESRVSALEAAVAELQQRPRGTAAAGPRTHPSLQVLHFEGGGTTSCVMEPDKPCVQSHACRTFGH